MGKPVKQPTAVVCLSPYSGGMELDAIKTAKHLSDITSVTVIAKKDAFIAKKHNEYVGYNDIKLESISFKSSLSLSIIFKIRKIIQKYNIKNILFFGASELKSLYFSFMGLDINLMVRHGTTKSSPKKDLFHRLIYSKVTYHIANSKHIQNNVKKIIPFGKNTRSTVIYPAFEFQDPKPQPHKKLTLLHVGRIAEGKGQKDAIQACSLLVANKIDFDFYIVGGFDETYKKEFLSFYDQVPYKEHIHLVGHTDNVAAYYNKADIFLFPSYGEGLSNAFIEALSFGLECICYENTSFPELKEMGFEFSLVANEDDHTLALTLLSKADRFKHHRHNTILARELFSLENERKNYMKILN